MIYLYNISIFYHFLRNKNFKYINALVKYNKNFKYIKNINI